MRRRVKDKRILGLIDAMLRAGVMEKGLFEHSSQGTPQGGILSPLLANIYLHELDCWWWESYGRLTLYEKFKRRKAGVGNCILTRYADDFIILCNGPRLEAERLREEVRQVLWEKLHLELSLEKSQITHVTKGFDFLGFHLKWQLPKQGKPWLRVTPSAKSVERFKRTIKALTRRDSFYQAPQEKIRSLNQTMRGWNQYYSYVNATHIASKLTFWANRRLFLWLEKRHKRGARWVMRTYRHREQRGRYNRWNLGVKDETGQMLYLYQLTDLPRRIYYARSHPHPYLSEIDGADEANEPFPAFWDGTTTPRKAAWVECRVAVLERDNHQCTQCGGTVNLQVHHHCARRHRGTDQMDNLQTLCERCHARTPTWGRPPGTGSTLSRRAG